jgi:hypothetical protein
LIDSSIAAGLQACSRPLAPQQSCSFVQNQQLQRISWNKELPLKLYIHNSVPPEAYAAIDRAVQHYNTVLGGGTREIIRVQARSVSGDLNPTRDGYSTMYWFNTWDPEKPLEQARTTIYWSGNEIFEADIRIIAADFRYFLSEDTHIDGVDLEIKMIHELGHALGLAHNVTTGSAMNFKLELGQNRRKLGPVDLTNLHCEY